MGKFHWNWIGDSILVSCPFCDEWFNFETPGLVDGYRYPEIKKSILEGSFFDCYCPGCNADLTEQYYFTYFDSDKKIRIEYTSFGKALCDLDDLISNNLITSDYINKNDGYRLYAVTTYADLISLITCIDHDFDFRVIKYFLYIEHDNMLKEMNVLESESSFKDAYIRFMDDKYMCIFPYGTEDDAYTREFDIEEYKEFSKRVAFMLNVTNNYLVDDQVLFKSIDVVDKEKSDEQITVYFIEDKENEHIIAAMLDETKNEIFFNIGFNAVVDDNELGLIKGEIIKIVTYNKQEFPYSSDVLSLIDHIELYRD